MARERTREYFLYQGEPIQCWIQTLQVYLLVYMPEIQDIYARNFPEEFGPEQRKRIEELLSYKAEGDLEPGESEELQELQARAEAAGRYVQEFGESVKRRLLGEGKLIREAEEFLVFRRVIDALAGRIFVPALLSVVPGRRKGGSKEYVPFYATSLLNFAEMAEIQDLAASILRDPLIEPDEKTDRLAEEAKPILRRGVHWPIKSPGHGLAHGDWIVGKYRGELATLAWADATPGGIPSHMISRGKPPSPGWVQAFEPAPCELTLPMYVPGFIDDLTAAAEAAEDPDISAEHVLWDVALANPAWAGWIENQLAAVSA